MIERSRAAVPAIDHESRAENKGRIVAEQEGDRRSDLVGIGVSPYGMTLSKVIGATAPTLTE